LSDFNLPDVDNSDDEEQKSKTPFQSHIPIGKTNCKEGRGKRTPNALNFLSDIVNKPQLSEDTKNLNKYRENEMFILNPSKAKPAINTSVSLKGLGIKNDPYKVSNAIIMEINYMAGQLFEIINHLNKLVMYKPKKVYKLLSDTFQRRLEERYGENILRHVI
jgi:hypothetical protein